MNSSISQFTQCQKKKLSVFIFVFQYNPVPRVLWSFLTNFVWKVYCFFRPHIKIIQCKQFAYETLICLMFCNDNKHELFVCLLLLFVLFFSLSLFSNIYLCLISDYELASFLSLSLYCELLFFFWRFFLLFYPVDWMTTMIFIVNSKIIAKNLVRFVISK